jgi:hypothetical protein
MASDDRDPGLDRPRGLPLGIDEEPGTIYIPVDVFTEPLDTLCTWVVVGESMIGDGIHPGDAVVVDLTQVPGDGDIAAVHISNWFNAKSGQVVSGWMVKRLRDSGKVLESSNPAYPPMVLRPEHSPVIRGVVLGVVTPGPDRRPLHWRRIREPRLSESSLPITLVGGDLADRLRSLRPGEFLPLPEQAG